MLVVKASALSVAALYAATAPLGHVLYLAAIASIVATAAVIAKYRESSKASERTETALSRERDAWQQTAERLENENKMLHAKNEVLESQPKYEELVALIAKLAENLQHHDERMMETSATIANRLGEIADVLRDVRVATVPPQ